MLLSDMFLSGAIASQSHRKMWHVVYGIWRGGGVKQASHTEHGYRLESLSRDNRDHLHLAEEGDLGRHEA